MAFSGSNALTRNANNDMEVQQPPTDSISDLRFSPVANFLCATSWDNKARVWEVQNNGQTVPKAMTSHDAPILSCSWHSDGSKIFTASCDKSVKMWDLNTNDAKVVAMHDDVVRTVHWIPDANVICTTSWDRTLKYWDLRSNQPSSTMSLPERSYCSDVVYPLSVVGTADRHIVIYDLRKPSEVYERKESQHRFQTRCVTCFPSKDGFALGSVEGRVAVESLQKDKSKTFSFKCQRVNNEIYAVNSIRFHPICGTFSTAGSDGTFTFWDKEAKQRLHAFKRTNNSISATDFNGDGSIFAYAVSYDWHKGHQYYNPQDTPSIFLHSVKESEVKPNRNSQVGANSGRSTGRR